MNRLISCTGKRKKLASNHTEPYSSKETWLGKYDVEIVYSCPNPDDFTFGDVSELEDRRRCLTKGQSDAFSRLPPESVCHPDLHVFSSSIVIHVHWVYWELLHIGEHWLIALDLPHIRHDVRFDPNTPLPLLLLLPDELRPWLKPEHISPNLIHSTKPSTSSLLKSLPLSYRTN